ncbi:MAG: heavy-metal-associated domain-containing protein [Methylophilaceae bacterium]
MLTFKVEDMTCGHCVGVITKAIKEEDESAKVEIDLPTKTVNIESSKPAESFVRVITEAGYTVS